MPESCSSSMRSAMWKRSSRSTSRSMRRGRMTLCNRLSHLGMAQYLSHARGQANPAFFFLGKLFAAARCERIKARLSVLLGHTPLSPHPTCLLHAMQRGIERSLLDAQQLIGNLVNVGGNGVAVHALLTGQRSENQQHQRALKDVVLFHSD